MAGSRLNQPGLGFLGVQGLSLGSKGGMKVGGVKEIGPNIVESTIGIL